MGDPYEQRLDAMLYDWDHRFDDEEPEDEEEDTDEQ